MRAWEERQSSSEGGFIFRKIFRLRPDIGFIDNILSFAAGGNPLLFGCGQLLSSPLTIGVSLSYYNAENDFMQKNTQGEVKKTYVAENQKTFM